MEPKTSTKARVLLFLNLICYVLAAAKACDERNNCIDPSPSAPSVDRSGGTGHSQEKMTCPRDALKLGVCATLLGGAVNVGVGNPPTTPCCSLLTGLVDLEAAVCLCTAIRANILGININIPVNLSLLLSRCGAPIVRDIICV